MSPYSSFELSSKPVKQKKQIIVKLHWGFEQKKTKISKIPFGKDISLLLNHRNLTFYSENI